MKKSSIYLLIGVVLAMLIKTGCSDINSTMPPELSEGIKSVVPARAPFGARVVIGGKGFAEVEQVLFNGTDAPIDAASDTAIITRVPMGAASGPIEVISTNQTFTGPSFTVDSTKNLFLSIEEVDPVKVREKDTVRISGTGFNRARVKVDESLAKDNSHHSDKENLTDYGDLVPGGKQDISIDKKPISAKAKFKTVAAQPEVYFNDISAPLISVSDTLIISQVPQGAASGLLSVIVEADTAIGPKITILKHAITGISPTSGTIGTKVTISGSDFSPTPSDNSVAFGGVEAPVLSASSTELITEVPNGASSGEVTVAINNNTVNGPAFNVEAFPPTITSITPLSGVVGTEVTIKGSNFSATTSENTVLFGEIEATIKSASETELITAVPEGAIDGPVQVQVGDKSTTGANFDVITSGTLIVTITTTGSDLDPDGYLISLDGDDGTRVAINDTLSRSGLTEGSYEVGLSDVETNCFKTGDFPDPRTVNISAGESTTIEYNISCEGLNEPPVAIFTSTCINLSCDFDASGSSDSDGSIGSYTWIFGDGTSGSGQTVSHNFETAGSYTTELTVTDNEGATDKEAKEITLTLPQITQLSPASGPIGSEVSIIGTGFSNTASENAVNFTSGSATVNATIKSASETELVVDVPGDATTGPVQVTVNGYTVSGPTFTVEFLGNLEVITSTTGSSLDSDGYLVNVQGVGEQTVQVNDTLLYNNIDVGSYQVGISDIASNCTLSEVYPNPRTVNVNQNSTTSTTLSIFCITPNEPPVAAFTSTCTNLDCQFNASESSDSDGIIASFDWQFGDAINDTGQTANHSYEVPGTYTIQLTVTDNDGATDVLSRDIDITIPEISGISPESGPTGTEVVISGDNFSSVASDNVVEFNGVRAELNSASKTEIVALVPLGATTGTVTVSVDGYTASGPIFTVQEPKTLEVSIGSEGTEIDSDGYSLSVTGESTRSVGVNDNTMYYEIYENNVEVELTGVANNCRVDGDNPRTVNLDNSDNAGFTSFTVDCTSDIRGFIVYQSTPDSATYSDIYLRNENRTINKPITKTASVSEIEPAISPDGLSITYSDGRYIYIMDSDGSDIRKIVNDGYNSSPSWSPKGDQIVFERFVTSEIPDLYIVNTDGSNLQNITNTETVTEADPDWSADGKNIVYSSNVNKSMSIYTIQPNGSGQNRLSTGLFEDTEPEWSPSGNQIAFTRYIQDVGNRIYIMNSDGSSATKLTYGSTSESSPSWSPDGTKIAYDVLSGSAYQIYIYSVKYDDVVNAYFTSSDDKSPHWNYQ